MPASMTFRGRGVNPHPPEPGTHARAVLHVLRREPLTAWPIGQLIAEAGLSERVGWPAVSRLLALALIQKHTSDDAVIRVRITSRGSRLRNRVS